MNSLIQKPKILHVDLKIGKVLSEIIKERRLTLKEISKATGISISTLGEWANNRAPRNPVQVRKVSEFLGVSMHHLLFGERDQQEPITLNAVLKEDLFQGTFEITIRKVKIKREDGK